MIDRISLTKAGVKYYFGADEVDEATYRERYPLPEVRIGPPMGAKASSYPYAADSLGVHPSQVEEARAAATAIGVPTDFAPDGSIIWKSRDHQRRYCQATGYVNRDETWSGRGQVLPPDPPKIRPKI